MFDLRHIYCTCLYVLFYQCRSCDSILGYCFFQILSYSSAYVRINYEKTKGQNFPGTFIGKTKYTRKQGLLRSATGGRNLNSTRENRRLGTTFSRKELDFLYFGSSSQSSLFLKSRGLCFPEKGRCAVTKQRPATLYYIQQGKPSGLHFSSQLKLLHI